MMILKYQYHINSQISDESQLENYSVMLLSFKSILAFILSERVILLGKPFVFHISALPNCCGNYLITADKKKQLRLLWWELKMLSLWIIKDFGICSFLNVSWDNLLNG